MGTKKELKSSKKSSELPASLKASYIGHFAIGMTKIEDEHLHILRGHLLIEERLRVLIELKFKKPDALIEARLTFNQIICIAKAFYWQGGSDWLWEGMMKLNNIRNRLSHNLTIKNYYEKVDDFLKLVEMNNPDVANTAVKELSSTSRLFFAMGCIYCRLCEYIDET